MSLKCLLIYPNRSLWSQSSQLRLFLYSHLFRDVRQIDKNDMLSWEQTLTPLIKAPGIPSHYLHQLYPTARILEALRKPLKGSY